MSISGSASNARESAAEESRDDAKQATQQTQLPSGLARELSVHRHDLTAIAGAIHGASKVNLVELVSDSDDG